MAPALWLFWRWRSGALQPLPFDEATHFLGTWTIRFILLALAVTPALRIFRWNRLALLRRLLGGRRLRLCRDAFLALCRRPEIRSAQGRLGNRLADLSDDRLPGGAGADSAGRHLDRRHDAAPRGQLEAPAPARLCHCRPRHPAFLHAVQDRRHRADADARLLHPADVIPPARRTAAVLAAVARRGGADKRRADGSPRSRLVRRSDRHPGP